MESCSICFLEFTDKPHQNLNGRCRYQKFLSCGHSLCFSCYLKLHQTKCPFCRTDFAYSFEDLYIKNKKNTKTNKVHTLAYQSNIQDVQQQNLWQPPATSQITSLLNESTEPFSRLKKNASRKRRRNLSFDEIMKRRQQIRKKCQQKWSHKEGRLLKELHIY
tara:strand:- start:3371 stop:3856 length:486 start_codon:yes stop_codon:yes gene_type:complete